MQFEAASVFRSLRTVPLAIAAAACLVACGGDAGSSSEPDCVGSACGGAGSGGDAGKGGDRGGSAGRSAAGASGGAGRETSAGAGGGGAGAGGRAGSGGAAGASANPDAGAPDASGGKDASTGPSVGDPTKPWKLLFVGNSFTFNSGIAGKVKELVNRGQSTITIQTSDMSVNWYRGLYYHWNFGDNVLGNGGNTRDYIRSKAYTHVVLQDFMLYTDDASKPNPTTGEGTYGLAISTDYSKRMIDEVKKYGQIPVVWSLFPEQGKQTNFEQLILAYKKIAQDDGAVFVPASAAWYLAIKERPTIAAQLWDQSDHFHPSGVGGYALACVFYAVLTGKTPVGNVYVSDNLDAATAKLLQEKAWQAYQVYGVP